MPIGNSQWLLALTTSPYSLSTSPTICLYFSFGLLISPLVRLFTDCILPLASVRRLRISRQELNVVCPECS